MKPHARNYIGPAFPIVLALNYLFSYLMTNLKYDFTIFLLIAVVLSELATVTYLIMKFIKDSNEFSRKEREAKKNQS